MRIYIRRGIIEKCRSTGSTIQDELETLKLSIAIPWPEPGTHNSTLARWLDRFNRGETVRPGDLIVINQGAEAYFEEAGPAWSRVTERLNPPAYEIKFKYETFCESATWEKMARDGLDPEATISSLPEEGIALTHCPEDPMHAQKITWLEEPGADPRENCPCQVCQSAKARKYIAL